VNSEDEIDCLAAAGTAASGPATAAASSPAPPASLPARLIVCERSGRWAVTLRRELAEAGVRVWETRTLADCWEELAASPASLLVVELGGDVAGLLRCLARLPRQFPRARLAVVADRSLASYEGLMREAGAVHFLSSPRRIGPLAQLACRHLAQVPPLQQNLTERIWAGLPWEPRGGARGEGRGTGQTMIAPESTKNDKEGTMNKRRSIEK